MSPMELLGDRIFIPSGQGEGRKAHRIRRAHPCRQCNLCVRRIPMMQEYTPRPTHTGTHCHRTPLV